MDKTKMKKAYKDARRPMGVFIVKNTQNDRLYIGCSTDLPARMNRHKAELKFGSHRNRELQKTWNLFGESAFDFEVLDLLESKEDLQTNPADELRALLEMWIHKFEEEGHFVVTL